MSKSASAIDLSLNGASILEGVAVGVTLGDAASMLEYMKDAVRAHEHFSRGTPANEEALSPDENDDVALASFDLRRVLSNFLIVSLKFEWSYSPDSEDNEFRCYIEMNHMNDGLGEFSQDWSTVDGLEDTVRLNEGDTMEEFLSRCFNQAIDYQVEMLWRAGIIDMTPDGQGIGNTTARQIAQSSWVLR